MMMDRRLLAVLLVAGSMAMTHAADDMCMTKNKGAWNVSMAMDDNCIMFEGDVRLELKYMEWKDKDDHSKGATWTGTQYLFMDKSATVDAASTCVPRVNPNDTFTQRLVLSFSKTWKLTLQFSSDEKAQFHLYSVELDADFDQKIRGLKDNPSRKDKTRTYKSNVPPMRLSRGIWAPMNESRFQCRKQDIPITMDKDAGGPIFVLSIVCMRAQAFASGPVIYKAVNLCPQDVKVNDLIPVLIGAGLAVIVVVTLIVYLIYRSRVGPSKIPEYLIAPPPRKVAPEHVATVDDGFDGPAKA